MHESIRGFTREAAITFTPEGVHLYGKDSAKTVFVRYDIKASEVIKEGGKYECTVPSIRIGICVNPVASCLRRVTNRDVVRFSVNMDKQPGTLMIMLQNKELKRKSCSSVGIIDIPEDPWEYKVFEDMGYNTPVNIPSSEFHDMMSVLSTTYMSEYRPEDKFMRVCCDGDRMVFMAIGKLMTSAAERERVSDSHKYGFTYDKQDSDRWPFCERFAMPLFQKIAKAKSVSNNMVILFQPNMPIIITYTPTLGSLSYIIALKDDPEWINDPASRKMPESLEDISITAVPAKDEDDAVPTPSKKRHIDEELDDEMDGDDLLIQNEDTLW